MKTTVVEQFLTDAKGRRTAVVLDVETYEHLWEAEKMTLKSESALSYSPAPFRSGIFVANDPI
jgi:hypothetical protein